MTSRELEALLRPKMRKIGAVRLLPAQEAIRLLHEAAPAGLKLLGIEAFRVHGDGKIEPSMEFSNICFGTVEEARGKAEYHPELRLRSPFDTSTTAVSGTIQLIEDAVANGFSWFEVTLLDEGENRLLFASSDA